MVIPKITPDMSFEEKRRIQAARFNMPLVADASKKMKPKVVAQKTDTKSNNTNIKNSNNKRGPTNHVNVAEHDGGATKKTKNAASRCLAANALRLVSNDSWKHCILLVTCLSSSSRILML